MTGPGVKRFFLLLVAVTFWLVACRSSAGPGEDGTPAETASPPPDTSPPAAVSPLPGTPPVEMPPPGLVVDAFGKLKEAPCYGGTLRISFPGAEVTASWDPVASAAAGWLDGINYESLLEADWSKGPQGTGENPMTSSRVSDVFLGPGLAASWEVVDLRTIIFHLRGEACWHKKPPLDGRGLTAGDVVFSVRRAKSDARSAWYVSESAAQSWLAEQLASAPVLIEQWLEELNQQGLSFNDWAWSYVQAVDEATVIYRSYTESTRHLSGIGTLPIVPREVLERSGSLDDWRDQLSTGPWMAADCVPGSSITWRRSPNYWRTDPFFPQNHLPYADRLIGLVIPDRSILLAALRTYKVDIGRVPWQQAEALFETSPELMSRQLAPSGSYVVLIPADMEPFNDIKVRQALNLAVDQMAIKRGYFKGKASLIAWPQPPSAAEYTPYEELPSEPLLESSRVSARELWGYDPDRARQLLAEAGYPDGFAVSLSSYTSDTAIRLSQLVTNYLADIGIRVTYDYYQGAEYDAILYNRQPAGLYFAWWNHVSPAAVVHWVSGGGPFQHFFAEAVDPEAEAFLETYYRTVDAATRTEMLRAESLRNMELAWTIPLPTPGDYVVWTPWVKGYSGEMGLGGEQERGLGCRYKYIWIDDDLRRALTSRGD